MKKTIFLLIVMFVLAFTLNAQNDTMYIIKQGNILGKYKVSDVDSVIFYKPSTSSSGTITGTASVCINGTPPVITFTGKDGKAPYTFIYKINNGAEITTKQTASGKDTIMIKAPTDKDGVFKYTLVKVKDASNTSFFKDNLSEITITVNALPKVDFTFTNNNTCSVTPIQFNPSLTGSYNYWWEFGDHLNSSLSNPVHEYYATGTSTQDFKIKLRINDPAIGCRDTAVKIITVKQGPHAALDTNGINGATYFDKINKLFVNCGATQTSPQFMFVAVNASETRASNTSYSIDWGDGTSVENLPASFTKITHSYNSLGFFNIKLISYNDKSECKSGVTIYKFFNGNSPGGNLGSVPNVNDCAPYTVKWPVQNTASNAPGTTYEFSVDDGTPPQKFDQSNLPDSITHTFTKSSCGLINNRFTVSFISQNPCDKSITTLQFIATEKPTAKFDIGSNLYLNNTVRFTNISTGTYIMGSTCNSDFDKTWTITPNTGWTSNLSNSNYIDVKFNTAGEYQVKLKIEKPYSIDSRCSTDSITKIITFNP